MDTDPHPSPKYTLQPTNALAGPSTLPDLPLLYLPPSGPPPPRPYLTSTQDLVGRFKLAPAYDKYVRPYAPPVSLSGQPQTPGATDKGKGKEKDIPARESSVPAPSPAAGVDGEEEDAKGEKKWKNSYKYLIKGIPGKHSTKKDDYLTAMIQVPPKQKMKIAPFDLKTQREAFSVSLEGIKGWNINTLITESPQAREDRKKRKELKRLAKAGVVPQTAYITASPTTTPATGRTGTPKPRPPPSAQPSSAPTPASQAQPHARAHTPVGIGTPQSQAATSPAAAAPVAAAATPPPRGVKREREGAGAPVAIVGAKAGNAGVRPRPLKKQRMDSQPQSVPVQQPTPHA